MHTRNVDVAIIGAGTAGMNARREVEKAGATPLLIDPGPLGTTCARVGCMPSKLLIAAADVAHEVAEAGRFGIDVERWRVDAAKVMERVRAERDRFVSFVLEDIDALEPQQVLAGRARFESPTQLLVDDHTQVKARAVVLAGGSHPFVPPPFDAISEHVLLNDDVFELNELPRRLAVIGTGIIGLELGQALQRLGVEVVFFNPFTELGPFTDPELKRVTAQVLSRQLNLNLQCRISNARKTPDGIELEWTDQAGQQHQGAFDQVLVTAGRRPNLGGLGLENTGLALDARGAPNWDPHTCQVADSPIFLAGDISGHRPLLHEASDEGRIAGANAASFPDVRRRVRRTPLAIAFTDPNMAMVGKSFAQLDPDAIEVGQVSFENQGRARVMGVNQGLLRVYGDRESCTLVGAEMLGPRAEHYAHLLAWAIQERMPVTHLLQMPFYHPVIEEGVRTALRDLAGRLRLTGECRSEDLATAPGM